MTTTEADLQKLEDEIAAQKAVFEKMATQMPIFTKTAYFSTKANPIRIDWGGWVDNFDGNERVKVTFNTSRGSNTLATLELNVDGFKSDLKVKRVPYSGGARWIIYNSPNYGGQDWQRIATNYTITVQSAVDGSLDVRMIWE